MDWLALLYQIFELCIIPLLGLLVKYAGDFLVAYSEKLKEQTNSQREKEYIEKITNTIKTCVIATNQTYVDTLKAQGKFDKEAQEIAFKQTYAAVVSILNDDIKEYIVMISGDLNLYLTQKIEAEVNKSK